MNTFSYKNTEVITTAILFSGAPSQWEETEGEGIKAGIIDTGVDYNHSDLKNNIADARSFMGKDPFDDNGHGTHICGIIAAEKNGFGVVGTAPKTKLYVAKAFDKNGIGDNNAITQSIQWLINEKVDVINMSFSTDEYVKKYHTYIRKAYNSNISVICATNNPKPNKDNAGLGYPALLSETISVSNFKFRRQNDGFSQYADLSAIGTNIYSTFPGNKYKNLTGTSMSTPVITGCACLLQKKAMLRLKRKLSPDELKTVMLLYSQYPHNITNMPYNTSGFFTFSVPKNISPNMEYYNIDTLVKNKPDFIQNVFNKIHD